MADGLDSKTISLTLSLVLYVGLPSFQDLDKKINCQCKAKFLVIDINKPMSCSMTGTLNLMFLITFRNETAKC